MKHKYFIKYTIIGAVCEIVDFGAFLLLTRFADMDTVYAHLISVNLGLVCSFLINAKLNFRTSDRMYHRLFLFFAIAWAGLAVSTFMMWEMVEKLGFYDLGAKIFTIILVGIYQFILNKKYTYRVINSDDKLTL